MAVETNSVKVVALHSSQKHGHADAGLPQTAKLAIEAQANHEQVRSAGLLLAWSKEF